MSKTVLVTGASGFIGHHLCEFLHFNKYNVIALGKKGENIPLCNNFIQCEIEKIPNELITEVEICFHQAANNDTTDLDSRNMMKTNLHKPIKLFEQLVRHKCKKFIYASSCSVYGKQPIPYIEHSTKTTPLNPYAESKLLFETFAKDFSEKESVDVIGLRYSNVYGEGEGHKNKRASMVYQLLQKMLKNERPVLFKYGEQIRDWVYVKDVIKANELSLSIAGAKIFNIGSGQSTSFNEIVNIINSKLSTSLSIDYTDCVFIDAYQEETQLDLSFSNKELKFFPSFNISDGINCILKKV